MKTLKQRKKNIKANSFKFLSVFIGNFEHNSYFLSSFSNSVCKYGYNYGCGYDYLCKYNSDYNYDCNSNYN